MPHFHYDHFEQLREELADQFLTRIKGTDVLSIGAWVYLDGHEVWVELSLAKKFEGEDVQT